MKNPGFQTGFALAAAFAGAVFAVNVFGQDTPTPMFNDIPAPTNTPATAETEMTPPPPAPTAPITDAIPPPVVPNTPPATSGPYLSPATTQILQLTQAKVSDTTIIAYVQNSSTMYGLNADQIIYLKQQGVSEGVLNAMLNQSSKVAADVTAQTPPPNYGQGTPPDQSSTAVVQPTTAAPSAVYTVPDSQTANYNAWASQYSYPYYYPYYAYYPYYYPYYYWPVTFSFVYGSPWYGWGWHGGVWHGGTWGGTWHGGTWGGSSGWHGGGTWSGGSGWHGGTAGGSFHGGGGMGGGGGFHH